jgi:hypothetical protein
MPKLPPYEFHVPPVSELLGQAGLGKLHQAVSAREPRLVGLEYHGRVDEAELMRGRRAARRARVSRLPGHRREGSRALNHCVRTAPAHGGPHHHRSPPAGRWQLGVPPSLRVPRLRGQVYRAVHSPRLTRHRGWV